MKNIAYYIYLPLIFLFAKLPYRLQFCVADFLYLVLYRVMKYRRGVVRENLTNSFAEKSQQEIIEIERKFYHQLADTFVEVLAMSFASKKQISKRMVFENPNLLYDSFGAKMWITAMAHYGNWEYIASLPLHYKGSGMLEVYRPLKNHTAGRIFNRIRTRFGGITVPKANITRLLIQSIKENKSYTVGLVSDQNPKLYDQQIWLDFLGRKTLFVGGVEKFATRFNMPVGFLHIEKPRRGHYIARYEIIYDGQEKLSPQEITRRYAEKLEQMIRRRPELWVWSHKRWKHRYEDHHPSENPQEKGAADE